MHERPTTNWVFAISISVLRTVGVVGGAAVIAALLSLVGWTNVTAGAAGRVALEALIVLALMALLAWGRLLGAAIGTIAASAWLVAKLLDAATAWGWTWWIVVVALFLLANAIVTARKVKSQEETISEHAYRRADGAGGVRSTGSEVASLAAMGSSPARRPRIRVLANVNEMDSEGLAPIHLAALKGRAKSTHFLIQEGADVEIREPEFGYTALHLAAMEGQQKAVLVLLHAGAEVNVRDLLNGSTPLHWAALNGHRDIAEMLLRFGAEPNAVDKSGMTPLDKAASEGHFDTVSELQAHGARLKQPPLFGI